MSANDNSKKGELRPDLLVGRKLPAHSLWEQLQRRAQPLALEFCSGFLNGSMSYKDAVKWLESYGIKISKTALHGFYNSMDIRLRYASLQAAQSADTAKSELPADIEAATKERIAQTMFELAFMPLGESQRLQLIQIQQNKEGMQGNFALKKAKLDFDREKFEVTTCKTFLNWYGDKRARDIAESNIPNAEKIAALRQTYFKEIDELEKSGSVEIPK